MIYKKYLCIITCCIGSIHASDNDLYERKSYTPSQTCRPQPIQHSYPIATQLLKNEIRQCGAATIRQRMQEQLVVSHSQANGRAFFMPNILTIMKTFYPSAQDQFSRAVFESVTKNESQPDFHTTQSINYETGEILEATPKMVDRFTHYEWITSNGMRALECRTIFTMRDEKFIEDAIADVEKNG